MTALTSDGYSLAMDRWATPELAANAGVNRASKARRTVEAFLL